MITRQEIRDLAEFQLAQGCAVTFYYQPDTPQNQSHREEAILVKDLVRGVLRQIEKDGRNVCARADFDRILDVAERLHGNGGKAKVIFADAAQNFWREHDIPACLDRTQLIVNRRFHLKPLAPMLEFKPRICVCLVDRSKARLFDYQNEKCKEVIGFFNELPRLGESESGSNFAAGHIARRLSESAKQHYKQVVDTMLKLLERGSFENLAVGIGVENWAEFELLLHPYLRKILIGRFQIDPYVATSQQIKDRVDRLLEEREASQRQGLLREVLGEAQRNGRGAVGLRRVLRSLEQGEIQTLLLEEHFRAPGVECSYCGHVDLKVQPDCAICRHPNIPVADISDAILGIALRNGLEVVYVQGNSELQKAGNIAALLRFRADKNKAARLAS